MVESVTNVVMTESTFLNRADKVVVQPTSTSKASGDTSSHSAIAARVASSASSDPVAVTYTHGRAWTRQWPSGAAVRR
jgi:hypothetical protein